MTWRNQIDSRTNAANVSAVWKYLKLSEKDAKIITSMKHRLRETISDEKRKSGWCWLLYDDWNREMASND